MFHKEVSGIGVEPEHFFLTEPLLRKMKEIQDIQTALINCNQLDFSLLEDVIDF